MISSSTATAVGIGDELTSVGNSDGEYRVRVETRSFSHPLGEAVYVTVLTGRWTGQRVLERVVDLHI